MLYLCAASACATTGSRWRFPTHGAAWPPPVNASPLHEPTAPDLQATSTTSRPQTALRATPGDVRRRISLFEDGVPLSISCENFTNFAWLVYEINVFLIFFYSRPQIRHQFFFVFGCNECCSYIFATADISTMYGHKRANYFNCTCVFTVFFLNFNCSRPVEPTSLYVCAISFQFISGAFLLW